MAELATYIVGCPTHFNEDATRSRSPVYRSVLGWCGRERHAWEGPGSPSAPAGRDEWTGIVDSSEALHHRCYGNHLGRGQGNLKAGLDTAILRVAYCRRAEGFGTEPRTHFLVF